MKTTTSASRSLSRANHKVKPDNNTIEMNTPSKVVQRWCNGVLVYLPTKYGCGGFPFEQCMIDIFYWFILFDVFLEVEIVLICIVLLLVRKKKLLTNILKNFNVSILKIYLSKWLIRLCYLFS